MGKRTKKKQVFLMNLPKIIHVVSNLYKNLFQKCLPNHTVKDSDFETDIFPLILT